MDCPNVAAFGPDGALYVTCSGEEGRPEILRIAPGGDPVERWTDAVPGYPNGCVGHPGRLGVDRGRVARPTARSRGDRSGWFRRRRVGDRRTSRHGRRRSGACIRWVTLGHALSTGRARADRARRPVEVVLDDHLARRSTHRRTSRWSGPSSIASWLPTSAIRSCRSGTLTSRANPCTTRSSTNT